MNKAPGIMMQQVIITCSFLGFVYNVPLYEFGTSAPAKLVKTRIGEIPQVFTAQKTQHTNFPIGRNNRFSDDDSSDQNGDYFYPAPSVIKEKIKLLQPSEINKLTQENDQFSDIRIPVKDDHGSNDNEKVPAETQKTGSDQDSDGYGVTWAETGTDFTAETSEYETTTDILGNRLGGAGGAPPAVVASLLG